MKCLIFAHGIDLITADEEEASIENANSVSEHSRNHRMAVDLDKTKVMAIMWNTEKTGGDEWSMTKVQ